MLNDGDCIEFLADVRAPVAQAGKKGERRIVGKTIGNYPANYLFRGGYVRKVEEPPAEIITAPAPKAQAAPEREKQERSNENGEDDGRADQKGDNREQDQPETETD